MSDLETILDRLEGLGVITRMRNCDASGLMGRRVVVRIPSSPTDREGTGIIVAMFPNQTAHDAYARFVVLMDGQDGELREFESGAVKVIG